VRIAIAQLDTTPGAFEQTIERLVVFSRQAQEQGAELVVFPLMTLTGAIPPSGADAPSFVVDTFEALSELVDHLPCPAVVPLVIGYGENDGYYEAMLLDNG
jgi:NAD+ synthase (glutamine-hydrolysing)